MTVKISENSVKVSGKSVKSPTHTHTHTHTHSHTLTHTRAKKYEICACAELGIAGGS